MRQKPSSASPVSVDSIDLRRVPFDLMQDFEWANSPVRERSVDIQLRQAFAPNGKHAFFVKLADQAQRPRCCPQPALGKPARPGTPPAAGGSPARGQQ